MGKASNAKRDGTRRQKIAAQQARDRRADVRKRVLLASGSVVAVIAVVVALVLVRVNSTAATATASASNGPTGAALATVVTETTHVPASTLNTVRAGSGVTSPPTSISGPPLTSGGKPEVLYIGGEYCPFCAAERWAMVVALSRFGTFTGLSTVHSAAVDGAGTAEPAPNTATFTFAHATYTSKYLTFVPVEEFTNVPDKSTGSYTTLQTPTSAENALVSKYDAAQQGAIPFIDFGNKYMVSGSSYNPQVLQGKSWGQIASALKDPSSPIAQAVDGTANYLTAAIAKLTGDQPATASTPAVRALEAKI